MTEDNSCESAEASATNSPTGLSPSDRQDISEVQDLESRLRKQVEKWQSKLLDLGNRNPLINCSFNPTRGVIELVTPEPEIIWRRLASAEASESNSMRFPWRRDLVPPPPGFEDEGQKSEVDAGSAKKQKEWSPSLEDCRASRRLGDRDLLSGIGDRALERRLRTLDGHAHLSLSEQGVHCLYMAFGFLKWFESVDSDIEHYSPLMLVPMTLSRTSADAPWELTEAEDDAIDNLCLRERLKQDFGMSLPNLPDIDDLEEEGARQQFLKAIRDAVAANERWEVQDRCALGRFAFPKVAMWQDLGDHVGSVLTNALCRSIGGDATIPPQQSFGLGMPLPEAAKLDDEIAPGDIKTILDCDSSQLEAIVAARRGVSFVLDGPPGTGKSQTIANIIADALSEGRRVLFVSEKVSALDVVKRRLDDCGLGDFCLECHSSKANRKTVLDELKYCLDLPIEVYDDVTPKLEESKQKRSMLNNYVRSIHLRRPPLGLSPYELYGHVSRFHRLGHAVKSRCELPSIERMDRPRFESWLELLERATDSENVIKAYHRHPWKGCHLTTRTLTLSDELNQHLGILASAFDSIHHATLPLVNQGLLPSEPNLINLSNVFRTLRDSLEIPQVPAAWFGSPRAVAATILRQYVADRELESNRARLPEFVDDMEQRFPYDQLAGLQLSAQQESWLARLDGSVPASVRKQHQFLIEPLEQIQKLLASIEATTTATAKVVGLFPVPLRADLPPYRLPAVVDLARLVAKVFPMRPEWLVPQEWPRLRAACEASLANLEEASRITLRVESRLSVAQLTNLHRTIEAPELLDSAWSKVKPIVAEGDTHELAVLQEKLNIGLQTLRQLQVSVEEVLASFGIAPTSPTSMATVRSLESAIPLVLKIDDLTGQWLDVSLRAAFRTACDAAICDVEEAAELRQLLEQRLSHRAFKSTAVDLADRAPAYQSYWRRLFGGFNAYRQEVTELFKGGTPPTPELLADLLKLRTWHRRMAEIAEVAERSAAHLPDSFRHEDPAAWKGVREKLQIFDQLASEAPEIIGQLPPRAVAINRSLLNSILPRLVLLKQQFRSSFAGTQLEGLIEEATSLDELFERMTNLLEAITVCQSARIAASHCYSVVPRTLSTIIADLGLASRYLDLNEDVRAQFRPLIDSLPADASPTDPAIWKRVQENIVAAERLSKLVPSLEKYQEALCQSSRLDPVELAASAAALETNYRNLVTSIRNVASHIAQFAGAQSVEDLMKRPLTELLAAAQEAFPQLAARHQVLTSVIPTLRAESDIDIAALPTVLAIVEAIRLCKAEQHVCASILNELGIDLNHDLNDGGRAEATWLLEQANAGAISPLVQAVACSPLVRTEIARAVESIQNVSGQKGSTSLKFLKMVFSFQDETGLGLSIPEMPLGKLSEFLQGLRSEIGSLDEWLKFARWRRDMQEQGFSNVVDELLANQYEPTETKSVITARFFRLVFDQFAQEDRLLGEFDLDAHEQVRERFRKLDEWEVRAASSRIRQYQLGRDDRPRAGWFAEATSELGILQKEIQKKRRQLPLRKLFAEIPSILQRLKPCIMMSPLSVSTFLQSDELRFDLVIFDEASQVFPWDAIGAIYRGTQLIVAGDEKQLPPTNFFNRADIESDEEDSNDISDYESILSLCKSIGMPGRGLRWHYRSRREPLIAFSNRHFYNGDLVTFPSIRDATGDAVRLEFVPQGRWIDRTNRPEAERVTDLIVHHLRSRPEASLGIISLNQSQQVAIEDSIYERRRKYPEVEALFHIGLSEPMFVKNLENVQGDERDVIFLSMGYGYNEAGKFLKNFGPLTKSGGERRLNVAVTRAREEVVLVASVKSVDIDLSGSTSQGSHLLKSYLEYAERGVDSLAREIDSITGEVESPFEQEVATALTQQGLHPVSQVGCGGFRIDLALKHPQRPGEFCLGIECDGATYHSSKTARDRDRIRQSVLEDLGWRIIRIWSTDWIRNPDRQVARILSAYEQAISLNSTCSPVDDSSLSDDLDEIKPRIETQVTANGPVFKAIKDVPEDQLQLTFQRVVKRGGAIDLEGLIQQTVRELGFGRTGKQIRQRLETSLNNMLQLGHLRWVGDRITIGIEFETSMSSNGASLQRSLL